MAQALLIDTDVQIDYLRDQEQTIAYLESLAELPLMISAVTVAELYAGVREGTERQALDAFAQAFEIVPLDSRIAVTGGLYRRNYGKSHGVGLADALIAASSEARGARLVTLNGKHFPMLTDVIVPYVKTQP